MVVVSPKKYVHAVCLSGIFGIFGAHHFYLGCWLHGLFDLGMTVTAFCLIGFGSELVAVGWGILAIDIIHTIVVTSLLLVGSYRDGTGLLVCYPGQQIT